jgi:hypothetical protein
MGRASTPLGIKAADRDLPRRANPNRSPDADLVRTSNVTYNVRIALPTGPYDSSQSIIQQVERVFSWPPNIRCN